MEQFLIGLGIGSAIFTTGFLLALGAFAGTKAASFFFGSISIKNVHFKD